jgi:hypothetical protein
MFLLKVVLPVNDVSQEVVVLQAIVDVDLLVVDRQGSGLDATFLENKS